MNEILDYIEEHLMDVREAHSALGEMGSELDYYEGSIETLEHLLAKFGRA